MLKVSIGLDLYIATFLSLINMITIIKFINNKIIAILEEYQYGERESS